MNLQNLPYDLEDDILYEPKFMKTCKTYAVQKKTKLYAKDVERKQNRKNVQASKHISCELNNEEL